jgi:hypothetical protein
MLLKLSWTWDIQQVSCLSLLSPGTTGRPLHPPHPSSSFWYLSNVLFIFLCCCYVSSEMFWLILASIFLILF